MTVEADGQQDGLLNSPALLRKIDQMRERNIGKYLPLPQLVAVGDQSSGKSSLLESLTGVSFPRGQELCTRYATQITHRRDDHAHVDVSIIPDPHATAEHSKRLKAYAKHLYSSAQLRDSFSSILEEVNDLMGIRTAKNPTGNKTFSQDTLKIEKCGPNEDYLTVIDVPGIFRTTTAGVTTANDQELVRNMVKEYIKDSRTIILAVLPSNVDVATQEILTLAEKYDKAGERTLGILTKPDLVTERSAKLAVCSLIEGKKKPLNLGYFVVRNRGGDDEDDAEDGGDADVKDDHKKGSSLSLGQRESMFQQEPWSSLPDERVGVSALRRRLQELLGQITFREFPKLRAETRMMLQGAHAQLRELGPSRQTEREQQQYLVAIAGRFQQLVRAALEADYSAHAAFGDERLRLITTIVNITDQFSKDFKKLSRTYLFESETAVNALGLPDDEFDAPADEDSSDDDRAVGLLTPAEDFPDLDSIVVTDVSLPPPKAGIKPWIKSEYQRSRGITLGTFGPAVLASVFREQSVKWEPLAKRFVGQVIQAVHQFVSAALEVVCADEMVRKDVKAAIASDLFSRYVDAIDQAKLLVHVERHLKPFTLNNYFNSSHQKSQGDRTEAVLKSVARREHGHANGKFIVDLDAVAKAVSNKSNEEHAVDSIHDILLAYYKVATKRFVDNIFQQVVDYKLLSGPSSPLQLFSEQWVLQLSAEDLAAVAGESRMTRDRREKLKIKVLDLEAAVKILR